MQAIAEDSSSHIVFISDDAGMNLLYPQLLIELRNETAPDSHISLLYLSNDRTYTFGHQIKILSTRFPTRLIGYFESVPLQEHLELILNTNTKKRLKVCLALDENVQETILSQLRYLGIKPSQITIANHTSFNS